MRPTQITAASMRHAALVLHGMSDEDRDWILAALPGPERERLLPLLLELQEIGVTRDASVLDRLAAPSVPQRRPDPGDFGALDRRSLSTLARVLNAEPPHLVACFLASGKWPWHARLARLLDPRVCRPTSRRGMTPALQHALLAAVGAQLESERARRASNRHVFTSAARRWRSIWSAR